MDRRNFLRLGGLSALSGLMLCNQSFASSIISPFQADLAPTERKLFLLNTHTDESLDCKYFSDGSYNQTVLSAINKLLRDHRTGDIHSMDPKLLDQLSTIAQQLDVEPVFHVISGFRSPKTNNDLRRRGNSVARKSYHLLGQAVDIRIPGTSIKNLHQAARTLKQGGVGSYKRFVHVDTGPVRHW